MCLSISSIHCAAFVDFLHMNVRDCLLTDYEQTLRRLDATDCFGREAVVRGKFVSDSSITGSGPTRYQGPNGFSVSFSVIQHCKIVARKQSVSNIGNCYAEGQPKFLFCSMMIRPNQLAFRCDCGKSPIPTRATIVGHTVRA